MKRWPFRPKDLDILIDPATITAAPADTPITTPAAFIASDERHRDFPGEPRAISEPLQPGGDVSGAIRDVVVPAGTPTAWRTPPRHCTNPPCDRLTYARYCCDLCLRAHENGRGASPSHSAGCEDRYSLRGPWQDGAA